MVSEEVGLWKRVEGWKSRSWDELRSHIHVAKAETSLVIKGRRDVRVLISRLKAGSGKTEDSFLGIGEGRLRVCPVAFAYVMAPKVRSNASQHQVTNEHLPTSYIKTLVMGIFR